MNTPTKLLALFSAFALASCEMESHVEVNPPGDGTHPLAKILLSDAPADALSVTAARKIAKPGTEIIVAGDIIGKPEVFVGNRAMLTIGDPTTITSCNRMPEDACATPWDVCCDDPDVIKASIATVQVLGADGKPFKGGLKGLGGMKELSSVIIKGTVAEGSNADNLLITATGIHIASVEANNTPK